MRGLFYEHIKLSQFELIAFEFGFFKEKTHFVSKNVHFHP